MRVHDLYHITYSYIMVIFILAIPFIPARNLDNIFTYNQSSNIFETAHHAWYIKLYLQNINM